LDDLLNHLSTTPQDCRGKNVDVSKSLPVHLFVRGDKMVMMADGKEVAARRAPADEPEADAPDDGWPDTVPTEGGGSSGYFAAGAAYGYAQHTARIGAAIKMPWEITRKHHNAEDEAAFARGAAWALMLGATHDQAVAMTQATAVGFGETTPYGHSWARGTA